MSTRQDRFSLELQPSGRSVIDALGSAASEISWQSVVVCVAYATFAGVSQLVGELKLRWSGYETANKLFVVGLDFGLTEPAAVRYLLSLPNTACHIHEARRTLSAQLRPRPLFHPKLYAFGSSQAISKSDSASGVVGSANLTGAALTSNFEAYSSFSVSKATPTGRGWLRELATVERHAKSQEKAVEALLSEYEALRSRDISLLERSAEPPPATYSPTNDLTAAHLRALRAARCLWTQTLRIVDNLGAGRPGNQVDLKRGARTFFGSNVPLTVPVNTPLGSIRVVTGAGVETCNLRYGNNGMDKVNLPRPGGGNPATYANTHVVWERQPDGSFSLRVQKSGAALIAASQAQGTHFYYAGRQRVWGFFS
jgi:hypothetical protein